MITETIHFSNIEVFIMKKWYYWLLFSGIWMIGAIIDYIEERNNPFVAWTINPFKYVLIIYFLILALFQFICDKRGKQRIFKYITIGGFLLLVLCTIIYVLKV